ncbi:MAG: DUF2178 domain-containing protein, partial [Xanthomonadales bacterium]|nr:DUF2178 domain-containing protein [Xanthomonadales bacterium]
GMSVQARAIGSHIAMLVIFGVIVMRVLRQRWRDTVEHDERDRIIQARANSVARIGLSVFVFAVAVLFAFSPLDRLTWAKPMMISNMMMLGLVATSVLEYAVIGISYWRDRL